MRKLVLGITFASVFSLSADASVQRILDNSVIELNTPNASKLDDRTAIFGGGFHLRAPNTVFQPFIMTPPNVKSGCGGIDIAFGGFSYFNPQYLVQFVQAVASQAPAFFFKMAISTLCPQCSQLLDNLTSLANQINQMGLDSCQAASSIGGALGKMVGTHINEALGQGTGGPSFLDTINSAASSINNFIGQMQNNFTKLMKGSGRYGYVEWLFDPNAKPSLLDYSLSKSAYYYDQNLISIVRGIVGDIRKPNVSSGNPTSGEGSQGPESILKLVREMPLADNNVNGIKEWISSCNQFANVDGINSQGVKTTVVVPSICYTVMHGSLFNINSNLDKIFNKLINRQRLDGSDLMFLNAFNFPVYKLLNTLSLVPETLNDDLKISLAKILAGEIIYSITTQAISELNKATLSIRQAAADQLVPVDMSEIDQMELSAGKTLSEIRLIIAENSKDVINRINTAQSIDKLRWALMSNLLSNPVVGSAMFGGMLR